MTYSKVIWSPICFFIVALCLSWVYRSVQAYPHRSVRTPPTDSVISSQGSNLKYVPTGVNVATEAAVGTTEIQNYERKYSEFLSDNPKNEIETNRTQGDGIDNLKELLNPFMGFPFFPFHFPNLKREIFRLNSTETSAKFEKDSPLAENQPMRKPFFFIDFEFNIRKIPLKNETNEIKPSRGDSAAVVNHPKKFIDKINVRQKDVPFDAMNDDDWSLFDESPLLPPDMDEFLPKSDFLFFDFPFHRKQSKKFARSKRDNMKPRPKDNINFMVDIFDEAITRTKNEMERSAPIWDVLGEAGGNVHPNEKRNGFLYKLGPEEKKMEIKEQDKHMNEKSLKGEKRSLYEPIHHKNPVILGKVVKIGEIHFGDDYQKGKKKRRAPEKKVNQGIREASIELVQLNGPGSKNLELIPFQTSINDMFRKLQEENVQNGMRREKRKPGSAKIFHKTDESKIMELLTNWDRREIEENAKTDRGHHGSPERFGGSSASGKSAEDGFAFVDSVGFEKLKPQTSVSSQRREGISEENETAAKEEVRRNITQILGQFFSIIKTLGDSNSFYNNKEVDSDPDMDWTKQNEIYSSGRYGGREDKTARRVRDTEVEEEEKSHPIADLNYLFLTVTLPTMLAFTLLLVICFFNLRVKGWLCTKLFKPRHVYVVEGDVEKPGRTAVVMGEVKDSGKTFVLEEEILGDEKTPVQLQSEKVTVLENSGDAASPDEQKTKEKSEKIGSKETVENRKES